ncbi:Enoyl-CoA hydratase/carnithine racemase [Modestobacter sp. DSM 44400]|uniref:enoyl-CoA hydratase/isomerase family protein n=1 Tax=Modestobacter sp. DSM 44400 TaxID=1550230 RepID=UPI0008975119|nr:enoyl-CoA hydratase/isomerase family protein [Modestobacter sp. DSM 44400]SDX66074.1 Enoyl-CoA hydratase/carnithine racemase [Modestobacter sp. DSM 44400]
MTAAAAPTYEVEMTGPTSMLIDGEWVEALGGRVISAISRFFRAGGDLDEHPSLDPADGARELSLRMQRVLDRFSRLPAATVAALNGHAVGGGHEIALACDLRVADASSRLLRPEVGMGLVPPWGGLGRMRELFGRNGVLQVLLVDNRLDAHRAREIGLVDVVAEDSAAEEATRLTRAVAVLPRPSVRAAKQLLAQDASAHEVAEVFGRLWQGEEHRTVQQGRRHRRRDPLDSDARPPTADAHERRPDDPDEDSTTTPVKEDETSD